MDTLPKLGAVDYDLFSRCRAIKDRYPDGVPLNKQDRETVLTALRKHPNGKAKFGTGVRAVVVDTFISQSRCFFVIRTDGTAEDFSLYKCFGRPIKPHTGRLAYAMQLFNYQNIAAKVTRFIANQQSKR